MQLDLFADGRDTELRNTVFNALLRFDLASARQGLAALAEQFPDDELLSPAQQLIEAEHLPARFQSAAELVPVIAHCESALVPAAARVLGREASGWLQDQVWARLAAAAEALPYASATPELHATPLWLRAGNWQRAVSSLERIPSWRRVPHTLRWRVIAAVRADQLDLAWPWIFELAWMAPAWLAPLIEELAEPILARLATELEPLINDGELDLEWFPAFALVARPALAVHARAAAPARASEASRAFTLVAQALDLEKRGAQADLAELRAHLRALAPALFRFYLRTR